MATTLSPLTFHESYGEVTKAQLAAYKKHNVSPADHRDLEERFGNDHAAITACVKNPAFHCVGSTSFSAFALWNWA